MSFRPRWAYTLTHLPTDYQITVDSNSFRSMHLAKEAALSIIKSRLASPVDPDSRWDKEVAVYDLPDDEPFPHELLDYRQPIS